MKTVNLYLIMKLVLNYDLYTFRREYVFRFNEKFQIQDDIDILKRMGLLLGTYLIILRLFHIKSFNFIAIEVTE